MIGLLLLLLVAPLWANCPHDVAQFASRLINRDVFSHSTWRVNISILDQNTLTPIFGNMAKIFSVPASNNKVLTTSAAYTAFGPDWRSETTAYLSGNTLCVLPGGDAALSHASLASFARQLAPIIPKTVHLMVDDSFFGFQSIPGGWEWSDMFYDYGAPPTATVLEHNTITLTIQPGAFVGATPVITPLDKHDTNAINIENNLQTSNTGSTNSLFWYYNILQPGKLVLTGQIAANSKPVQITPAVQDLHRFAKAFGSHLADQGIQVPTFGVSTSPVCKSLNQSKKIGAFPSPPLYQVMNHTLQTSDNLEAELWMRHLGNLSPNPAKTNYDNGIQKVIEILKSRGVDTSRFYQTDGSGLGRSNLVQPDGEVETLYTMRNEDRWISFLPVGGKSGTLAGRFIGTPAEGRVHAKTGTLTGVNALSGYVYPRDFQHKIIFSIIANDSSNIPNSDVRKGMDEIVVEIAKLTNDCSFERELILLE